ncbi:MAG: dihydropteroate synthase [Bacteroidia bacterium]|nr:dihydropteroate synthase [Bacteroidales bacterium]TFH50240.1 MAG: dihydropteroate synthase [Bacteroidia bacterium]
MFINIRGRLFDLARPRVMGIINVTGDSFYEGSRYESISDILKIADKMLGDGADILDIGGCSTRPGATEVPEEEEKKRVCNAAEAIRIRHPEAVISVDTYRSAVAEAAVSSAGADIINDISGGEMDERMFTILERLNVPYIMMHMQGTPATMQKAPHYENVVTDIISWFTERMTVLHQAGVKDIIIDPGFGFGKTADHNFEILRRLEEFKITSLPLLAGLSRKSMIWRTLEITPEDALTATAALNMTALMKGASILRVHDVKEAREVVKLFEKIYPDGNLFDHYC